MTAKFNLKQLIVLSDLTCNSLSSNAS